MKLTLLINGEPKEFGLSDFIPANVFRKSIQFAHMMDSAEHSLDPQVLERLVEFIADSIYGSQFTADEFWEGVDSRDFMQVLQNCITAPTVRIEEKMAPLKK